MDTFRPRFIPNQLELHGDDSYANLFLGGTIVAECSNCDLGRFVVAPVDGAEFDGCYPADDLDGLAYAIREIHGRDVAVHRGFREY